MQISLNMASIVAFRSYSDVYLIENADFQAIRIEAAELALQDMINYIKQNNGQVGIFDAINGTHERRLEILESLDAVGIRCLFIESICTDPAIVEANIRSVKISSPDYKGWNPDEAVEDFTKRIKILEEDYETIQDKDVNLPFVKLFNIKEHIVVSNVAGYLQTRIVYFLTNLHITPRSIYFVRVCFRYLLVCYIDFFRMDYPRMNHRIRMIRN